MSNMYKTTDALIKAMFDATFPIVNKEKTPLSYVTVFSEPFWEDGFPRLYPDDIKKVWFNRNKEGQMCTTVLWSDNTKTTVSCLPDDKEDKEKALAMCISKKMLGNKGNFNEVFKKYCFADED